MSLYNLVSLLGMVVLVAFAWLISHDRRQFSWRLVMAGLGLQLLFAAFIFWVPLGTTLFLAINDLLLKVIEVGLSGAHFLFGPLAASPGQSQSIGFILIFQAFPAIIFFAALMQVLYYYNILPVMVRFLAQLLRKTLKLSGAESLCAASNIFLGIDSLTAIRPYLSKMNLSEICTVLACGLATIASSMLGFYVLILKDQFPLIAGHLVAASLISAPAALVLAKVIWPHSADSQITQDELEMHIEKDGSLIEAIIKGATVGGRLVFGISVLLIAVLGLVGLFNLGVGGLSEMITGLWGDPQKWYLQDFLALVFYPFTLVIGVPVEDAFTVAQLLGTRVILTEVTAYQNLSQLMAKDGFHSARSVVLASYALCGFAHVASVAIFTGGLAAICPNAAPKLAKVAFRSLVAATLACLMTAAVAGLFYTEGMVGLS